jgi:hypothetical protein
MANTFALKTHHLVSSHRLDAFFRAHRLSRALTAARFARHFLRFGDNLPLPLTRLAAIHRYRIQRGNRSSEQYKSNKRFH